jgi:hypothetical protein
MTTLRDAVHQRLAQGRVTEEQLHEIVHLVRDASFTQADGEAIVSLVASLAHRSVVYRT